MENQPKPLKRYHQAPLPFVGQKRFFLKHFQKVLEENIPDDGEGWTIVDVFGGSGLLSNNAKHCKPQAQVIYNDFDCYTTRLQHIDDTNRLRQTLEPILINEPRSKRIRPPIVKKLQQAITKFNGYIDMRVLSMWLLFSGKHANSIDELFTHPFYNSLRKTDFNSADNYLTGIDVVSESYDKLLPQYVNRPNTLLILDPPYICTEQGAYANDKYFGMVQFLSLMEFVRPPYVFFSSTKSELLDYLAFIKAKKPMEWQRLGGDFLKVSITAMLNYNSRYEDNLIYNFGCAK